MRKSLLIAAAIAVATTPMASFAQDKDKTDKKAAASAAPGGSPEDIQRGVMIIRGFAAALNSENVTSQQKGAIIACLYNNPVRNLSTAAGKVPAENDKLDAAKPAHVHGVAAAICRVPRKAPDAAAGGTEGR